MATANGRQKLNAMERRENNTTDVKKSCLSGRRGFPYETKFVPFPFFFSFFTTPHSGFTPKFPRTHGEKSTLYSKTGSRGVTTRREARAPINDKINKENHSFNDVPSPENRTASPKPTPKHRCQKIINKNINKSVATQPTPRLLPVTLLHEK